MNVGEALQRAEQLLLDAGVWFGHGTDNAWDESIVLLSATGAISPDSDASAAARELSPLELEQFETLLARRIDERIPAPYLIGKAWFTGLEFHVDPRVLIPRSPIAELIRNRFRPWLSRVPTEVLDLCCGSGCIGIAIADEFPECRVTLADLSVEALEVARENVALHRMERRIDCVQSDLFDRLGTHRYDLIVTNPPYVDALDLAEMPAEYRHEPALGLASGDDGLEITRRILARARDYLTEEGLLVIEVGNSWKALEAAFPDLPLVWLEFAVGGHGVGLIEAAALAD